MINLADCPITIGTIERPLSDFYSRSVSVKDFGATGDGVTDDWATITDALEVAFPPDGTAGVGHLHFPAGHYMISKSLGVHNVLGGMISGDGAGSTRITFNGPLRMGRTVAGFAPGTNYVDAVFDYDGVINTTIRDLTLEMPYSADQALTTSSTSCLNLDRWSDATLHAVHGDNMIDMIFIGGDRSVQAAAGYAGVSSILGSEMAYIHCKFIEPSWNAIKLFSQNALSHHCWFCHFIRCGTTPTVAQQFNYAAVEASRGSVVALMFCIFEDSKDCDILPGANVTYMIACHHRSTVAKNMDNGPSMWVAGGGIRGQGLTFENTTADDTMVFQKTSVVLDVCDFKTGYAGNGEDYMVSHYKACSFGKASPFANTSRITVFVDDAFLKGPGALTPLVTAAPMLFSPTFSVGA